MIYKIKQRINHAFFFRNFLLIAVLWISSVNAGVSFSEKYLLSFRSDKSTCLFRLNDLPAMDNTTIPSGTVSAGFNITPYLENGANRVELLMGPLDSKDPKTLFHDSSCDVTFSKTDDGASDKISIYKIIVDDKKTSLRSNQNPTINYTAKKQSKVIQKMKKTTVSIKSTEISLSMDYLIGPGLIHGR